MGGHHVVLVGLATIGAIVEQRAGTRADVLTLMAFAAGTLADEIVAMFAEIIAPWIRVVAGGAFIEDQRKAVHVAGVGLVFPPRIADRADGEITVTTIVERLRIGKVRRFLQRKSKVRIDGVVGASAAILFQAGARNEKAGAEIAEVL